MRLPPLYMISALVILASCEQPAPDDAAIVDPTLRQDELMRNVEQTENTSRIEDIIDTLKIGDPLDPENSQLPILPPIVLLDFGNDDDNSTIGDEKTKRTIDGNLGYGFARNNLFNGRTNYYFPAGKSGTTVSIEESISPYQPKTIIETVKPISEKPESEGQSNDYQQKNFPTISGQRGNNQNAQSSRNLASDMIYSQSIFGQRTKLYKPSQLDYNPYRGFTPTPNNIIESYTTPRPDYRGNNVFPSSSQAPEFISGAQTTQSPFASYSTTAAPSYVTPTDASYQARYNGNSDSRFNTPRPTFNGIGTSGRSQGYSPDSLLAPYVNLPRFTVENGVRYENKIVWKYADGKISATPPTSYVSAYNEFLSKQNPGAAPPVSSHQHFGLGTNFPNSGLTGNYRNPGVDLNYQNLGTQKLFPNFNYQSPLTRYPHNQETRVPAQSFGNIHSKSPAQFPNDQEPAKPMRPSPFVSSASLQSGNIDIGSETPQSSVSNSGQSYDLGYQGQYGLKTSAVTGNNPGSLDSASNYKTKLLKDAYGSSYNDDKPLSKYAVNSPNPEYTYSTETSVKSTTPINSEIVTSSGSLTPEVLAKYSRPAQSYLTKVLNSEKSTKANYEITSPTPSGQSYGNPSIPPINTDYENLLSYNPSISQYIRNPSSILKAQPTYIQVGKSLIPVIILRVDGAPPIQPKVTPNINLKALLQQYLTQYAGNIGQNGKNDFENGRPIGTNVGPSRGPLYELTKLTQTLSQYSRDPSVANNFAQQFGNNPNENSHGMANSFPSRTSYDGLDKSGGLNNYGNRRNKPQKIKSVQIIDDPRFTSYKVNS